MRQGIQNNPFKEVQLTTRIHRKLNKIRKTMNEQHKFNKETKKTLKTKLRDEKYITEWKNSIKGFKGRLSPTEESVTWKTGHLKLCRERSKNNNEWKEWNYSHYGNSKEEEKGTRSILKNIMSSNFQNVGRGIDIQVQEAPKTPSTLDPNRAMLT